MLDTIDCRVTCGRVRRALEGQIEGLRAVGADSRGMNDKVAALERRVAELEKEKEKGKK